VRAKITVDLYKFARNDGAMHALDVLGDPVRRRILELLAEGELSAGRIGEEVQREFGISQPAVSQHLRVLREAGFTTVRPDGTRRLYAIDPAPLEDAAAWFDPFRRFWQPHLDALATELARGRRERRRAAAETDAAEPDAEPGRSEKTDESETDEKED
jgi:DNA-binding transcriptional ArsR family regulator